MNTTTEKKSFSEIIAGDTPVLVDFYATWCGPCKMMPPILDELKEMMGDQLIILKIDVDKNPLVSTTYKVQSIPTLMLFKNREVLWRTSGVMNAHQLYQIIKQYV
ncbi:MAG: thioredoxin [Cytophagaceae bacterium]|nr:thioredoxin [Cytophagaceae bacterium]MDW8455751.1 thioredoxin [Cytophagaceae bacterium]